MKVDATIDRTPPHPNPLPEGEGTRGREIRQLCRDDLHQRALSVENLPAQVRKRQIRLTGHHKICQPADLLLLDLITDFRPAKDHQNIRPDALQI